MAGNFDGEYGYMGRFDYVTNKNAIGLLAVEEINSIVTAKWGWRFIPKATATIHDQYSETWYKHQNCIISFDSQEDLTQVILQVSNRL
tara:strand:- start:912 stop:1175 length:264 start_codon:yes stop_codon:yes gene_type:complete